MLLTDLLYIYVHTVPIYAPETNDICMKYGGNMFIPEKRETEEAVS